MEHRAISKFWQHYHALQPHIRTSADKQFSLLKGNPQHRSLQFKKIGDRHGEEIYSARVTLSHRALAFKRYMNEASDKHQKFLNYLIEHQIFMTEELHDKFFGAQKALLSALTSYSVGKGTNHKLVREGQEELINNMQARIDETEKAVQKRLRHEEA
jgi:hypothetical protein